MNKQTIVITATFTAEPVAESLSFWIEQLKLSADLVFAPYNQVFQQLLDPSSLLSTNQHGCNVVLLRFEDWTHPAESETANSGHTAQQEIERNLQDLVQALQAAAQRTSTPYLLCLCPASRTALADRQFADLCRASETMLATELSSSSNVYFVGTSELMALYPVEEYDDPQANKLGHIPYTSTFFAALGSVIARRLYSLQSAPHKVVVLDCDQTLWGGVCGEVGAKGICLDTSRQAFQQYMLKQREAGILLCLCSKNNEEDVWEVFARRGEMCLRREHLTAWRINWRAKSENIRSLAVELGLGLDSFIFIDDDPVVCAEVQANCPEVLTLQLPAEVEQIPRFLDHVWAFDRLKTTREDQLRTAHYRQDGERERLRQQSMSFEDFLQSLELKIKISQMRREQVSRVAQLTQRTNQFNCTTIRRTEGEVDRLSRQDGWGCEVMEVSDRFGDYGLVGVMIYEAGTEAILVETMLLSCRALGRGVEHRMVRRLGEVARERGLSRVDVRFVESQKNQPAREFLESVGGRYKEAEESGGYSYRLPAEVAATLCYTPNGAGSASANQEIENLLAATASAVPSGNGDVRRAKSELLNRIARELYTAEEVLKAIERQKLRARPEMQGSFVAAKDHVEEKLVGMWRELLRVEHIGMRDDFFELGGTSLLAVRLFAQVEKSFGKNLPLATLFQAPTIEQLADILRQQGRSASWSSLVAIQPGNSKPPFFCMHGAGANVLVFRSLSRRLGEDQPFYGLQAQGLDGKQAPSSSVEEMASHYIKEIRSIQPEGPYLLGGFSMGGMVAFEMAQQLHAQGQKVTLLALFDTHLVHRPEYFHAPEYAKVHPLVEKARYNLGELQRLGYRKYILKRKKDFKIRAKRSLWRIARKLYPKLPQMEGRATSTIRKVTKILVQAERDYVPKVYPGRITLFWSSDPFLRPDRDWRLGWSEFAADGMEVCVIPGNHLTFRHEPLVAIFAEKLKPYLERAQATEPSKATPSCAETEVRLQSSSPWVEVEPVRAPPAG